MKGFPQKTKFILKSINNKDSKKKGSPNGKKKPLSSSKKSISYLKANCQLNIFFKFINEAISNLKDKRNKLISKYHSNQRKQIQNLPQSHQNRNINQQLVEKSEKIDEKSIQLKISQPMPKIKTNLSSQRLQSKQQVKMDLQDDQIEIPLQVLRQITSSDLLQNQQEPQKEPVKNQDNNQNLKNSARSTKNIIHEKENSQDQNEDQFDESQHQKTLFFNNSLKQQVLRIIQNYRRKFNRSNAMVCKGCFEWVRDYMTQVYQAVIHFYVDLQLSNNTDPKDRKVKRMFNSVIGLMRTQIQSMQQAWNQQGPHVDQIYFQRIEGPQKLVFMTEKQIDNIYEDEIPEGKADDYLFYENQKEQELYKLQMQNREKMNTQENIVYYVHTPSHPLFAQFQLIVTYTMQYLMHHAMIGQRAQ